MAIYKTLRKVLKLLVDCAVNMLEKCTIYSTLVGLLNAKNYNFGGEVSELNTIIKCNIFIVVTILLCVLINNYIVFFGNLVCKKHCAFFQR